LREISPAACRRLVGSFTSGFAGRPGKRTIAACFGFLIVLGFFFGIATPYLHCACKFSDKLSEKIVSLVDETDFVRVMRRRRKTTTTRLACIVDRRDRRGVAKSHNKIAAAVQHVQGMRETLGAHVNMRQRSSGLAPG
jgi:hypothetical protein